MIKVVPCDHIFLDIKHSISQSSPKGILQHNNFLTLLKDKDLCRQLENFHIAGRVQS